MLELFCNPAAVSARFDCKPGESFAAVALGGIAAVKLLLFEPSPPCAGVELRSLPLVATSAPVPPELLPSVTPTALDPFASSGELEMPCVIACAEFPSTTEADGAVVFVVVAEFEIEACFSSMLWAA